MKNLYLEAASQVTGVPYELLCSKRRTISVTYARAAAIVACYTDGAHSIHQISKLFHLDWSTVRYHAHNFSTRSHRDPAFLQVVKQVKGRCREISEGELLK